MLPVIFECNSFFFAVVQGDHSPSPRSSHESDYSRPSFYPPPRLIPGQVYIWNSKQGRRRTSRTRSAGPSCPIRGGGGGSGVAAPSSCPAPGTAAAPPTSPEASTGRVKSRASSSFNVECSGPQKVATVAVFLPPKAVDAMFESSVLSRAPPCGCSAKQDACAGGGAIGAAGGSGGSATARGAGGEAAGGMAKGRGGFCRTPSMPTAACAESSNAAEECEGWMPARRRRWSFAGQARCRATPAGSGGGAGPKVTQRTVSGSNMYARVFALYLNTVCTAHIGGQIYE